MTIVLVVAATGELAKSAVVGHCSRRELRLIMPRDGVLNSPQVRNWCFTWNNPDGEPDPELLSGCTYMVCQMEMGESGTSHYQGYVQMSRSTRLPKMRAWLPHAHWEVARGTPEQNVRYCTKEDSRLEAPITWGELRGGQGSRSDLLAVKKKLDEGARIVDLVRDNEHFATVLRNHRALAWYATITVTPPRFVPDVYVLVGPTGTGKTTAAKALGDTWYCLSPDTTWWDGYTDQSVVIFDEFVGKSISMEGFNMLYDGTRTLMPTKGGHVNCVASKFVFCSNIEPTEWWPKAHFPAFCRRVKKWVRMRKNPGDTEEFETYGAYQDAAIL